MSAWADGIRRVHDQAGGALVLEVVRRADVPEMALEALAGNDHAQRALRLAQDSLHRVMSAPRRRPMLCACCPRPVRRRREFAIVVAFPDGADATAGIGLAVCARCATTRDAIRAKAAQALKRIWPDGRLLTVTHPEGGRA